MSGERIKIVCDRGVWHDLDRKDPERKRRRPRTLGEFERIRPGVWEPFYISPESAYITIKRPSLLFNSASLETLGYSEWLGFIPVCPCAWPCINIDPLALFQRLESALSEGTRQLPIEDVISRGSDQNIYVYGPPQPNASEVARRESEKAQFPNPPSLVPIRFLTDFGEDHGGRAVTVFCDGNKRTEKRHRTLRAIPLITFDDSLDDLDYLDDLLDIGEDEDDPRGVRAAKEEIAREFFTSHAQLAYSGGVYLPACPCGRTDMPSFEPFALVLAIRELWQRNVYAVSIDTLAAIA